MCLHVSKGESFHVQIVRKEVYFYYQTCKLSIGKICQIADVTESYVDKENSRNLKQLKGLK